MMNRRDILATGTAAAALAALGFPASAFPAGGPKLGTENSFSFDALAEQARLSASKPYVAPRSPPHDILEQIDYQAHGQIKFDTSRALFADGPGPFPVTFFLLGKYFQVPVRMHVVSGEADNQVEREIGYDLSYFDMPADSPARGLPKDSGFAGFRLQESRLGDQSKLDWRKNDWTAFLGASYFRAIGELYQYGLSARGIAVDVGLLDRPEEFPSFTHFYFETPKGDSGTVVLYALLDGPSIAGAYRFVITRHRGVVMEIEKALFLRSDIARMGIAPMTSMYWFSETRKPEAVDWRPEIHDSDGLALWTGLGERIWRPLNNSQRIIDSSFRDVSPRGFGFLQRDRNFDHYQDGSCMTAGRVFGSSRSTIGARERSNSWRSRPTTKYKTTSSPRGRRRNRQRRGRVIGSATASTGSPTSPIRRRSRDAWRHASEMAANPASHARTGSVSS
jgi:periplasmic glucans biosynthesis protein